ncbi:MAG TPA: LapA family protein [Nannocystis sp.]|jgi:hypothetical protein
MTAAKLSRSTWSIAPVLAASLFAAPASAQGPMAGQPDPRAMSGLPRVDPQTEPGTVVIRVLRGSFQNPGVGLTVTLDLRSADGSKTEQRTAVSVEQGRATFADLGAYAGGTAVASVDFGGEPAEVVKSQELRLDPNVGVRMLLVSGASSAPAAAAPVAGATATPAAADVPRPGTAFPNPGQARGSVVVGTLDLSGGKPFTATEVTLEIRKPDVPVEQRKMTSDGRGAARFTGLADLPPGTTLVAEATLHGELKRSDPFSLDGQEHGVAVVLAVSSGASADTMGRPQRRPLQTPRAVPTVAPGIVRTTVFGPDDKPVGGVPVTVVKLDVTGTRRVFTGEAGPDGVAFVEDIALADDSLYHVEVTHDKAPFRSRLFQMGDRMGVTLEMRVFPTTSDVSKVRSAVQFGIEALENDQARVVQLHQALVEGDRAFWPATPLRIGGAEGATGMVVLDRASVELEHAEGSPFATLREPLPPGEVVDMSIAYLMPHHGTLALRWSSPLPVANGRAVVLPELKLKKGALGPPTRPPAQDGSGPSDFELYEIGAIPVGGSFDLEVEGLVTRPRTFRALGLALGLAIGLGALITLLVGPRASLQQRLERRRDVLLKTLDRLDAAPITDQSSAQRTRVIAALDQVYRQLDVFKGSTAARVDLGAAWDRKA